MKHPIEALFCSITDNIARVDVEAAHADAVRLLSAPRYWSDDEPPYREIRTADGRLIHIYPDGHMVQVVEREVIL